MARAVLGFLVLTFLTISGSGTSLSKVEVGEAAPVFTLHDSQGEEYSLESFKGKFVVLEWVNYDCPFVRKHYSSGNMQELQKQYRKKDVAWFSICSSAEGRQGYFEGDELLDRMKNVKAAPTAYLVDANGEVGKMYDARTTPHMFIIDPEGKLIYRGGIDDIPSTNTDDIPEASNYVRLVLDAVLDGRETPVSGSKPYGCSVKYPR